MTDERGEDGRSESWRERQRRVLTAFRKASKRNRSQIAAEVGLEYWQLVRLETGKSELPAKLLPSLAAAYGVEAADLIEQLGLMAESSLDAMLAAAGMPADERRQLLSTLAGQELTAEERQEFVTFWRRVQATRAHAGDPPTQSRLRA